jgi:ceramide glucosyltransferase
MTILWICLAVSLVCCGILFAAQLSLAGNSRAASPGVSSRPAVSVLKPLKGTDPGLEANLESFYALDYPEFEIVFSFASRDDEAFAVARRVADRHPEIPTAFVIDHREPGRNPKVSRLLAAVSRARHPILLISDGDVRVSPDYLSASVAEFDSPSVGLVSNPFRCEGRGSAGSVIEALHMNGFVLSGTAAVSGLAGRPCVVGKSIFLRRDALEWIGGLDAVRDHLAEDFLLGDLMSRSGFRVVLSRHFVTVVSSGRSVRSFWDRQVRWARMRRRLGGSVYVLEGFASPLPWCLIAAILSGFPGASFAIAAGILKIALDFFLLGRIGISRRVSLIPAILAKDLLAFGVFFAGLVSTRTRWRGQNVRIGKRTLLVTR